MFNTKIFERYLREIYFIDFWVQAQHLSDNLANIVLRNFLNGNKLKFDFKNMQNKHKNIKDKNHKHRK